MSTLTEIVHDAQAAQQTMPTEGWHVTDRSAAQWAMQRIYELRQQQDGIKAEAQQVRAPLEHQLALIAAWETQELTALEQSVQFFEGELIRWMAHERAEHPDLKSVKLAHGTVASRKKPDGIEIADEQAVLALAKAQGWTELVRVKEELNKSAVKEAVLKAGQVIAGVTKVEVDLVYEVKVAEVPDGQ